MNIFQKLLSLWEWWEKKTSDTHPLSSQFNLKKRNNKKNFLWQDYSSEGSVRSSGRFYSWCSAIGRMTLKNCNIQYDDIKKCWEFLFINSAKGVLLSSAPLLWLRAWVCRNAHFSDIAILFNGYWMRIYCRCLNTQLQSSTLFALTRSSSSSSSSSSIIVKKIVCIENILKVAKSSDDNVTLSFTILLNE